MAVALDDVLRLSRALWVRRLDVTWRDSTATRDVSGVASRSTLVAGAGARSLGALWKRYVQDVQFAASGGFDSVLLSRIVGHLVAVHHVVVPIALSLLQNRRLEAEFSCPCSRLGSRAGQRKLSLVAIP